MTSLPPINYVSEQESQFEFVECINNLTSEIMKEGIINPNTLKTLHQYGITHIYIGQRQGIVNNFTGFILYPETISGSDSFTPIYHKDRVWIFSVKNE